MADELEALEEIACNHAKAGKPVTRRFIDSSERGQHRSPGRGRRVGMPKLDFLEAC